MTEKMVCLVCGEPDFTDLFVARDTLVSGESFVIRKCTACGFMFTADPPAENEIGRYYTSDDYISHSDKKRNLTEYFYHLARSFMLGRKRRLVTLATQRKTGTLLDIGSGTGYFASFMQNKGWTVSGTELNDQARNTSVSRFGIKVFPPSEIILFKDRSADCITFWHVLEHLYDPEMWLREVKRTLKDDGRCIIAVPNPASADAIWFGDGWAALDVPRHLWHFTPPALIRFIEANGFKCHEIMALPLDVFYISILSYRNRLHRFPLLRGLLTGTYLAAGNLMRKTRASSLVFVISKKLS